MFTCTPKWPCIRTLCDLKGVLKWKSCKRTALNWQLMEHNDCHMHDNHMVLGIACCCFMCFMFVGCAFMETGTCFLGFRMWAFMLIYVGFCSSWRLVGIWLWLMHGIFGRWGAKDIWMGGKFSSRGSLCWILEKTEMRTKWLDIFVVRVCWVGCCVA